MLTGPGKHELKNQWLDKFYPWFPKEQHCLTPTSSNQEARVPIPGTHRNFSSWYKLDQHQLFTTCRRSTVREARLEPISYLPGGRNKQKGTDCLHTAGIWGQNKPLSTTQRFQSIHIFSGNLDFKTTLRDTLILQNTFINIVWFNSQGRNHHLIYT